MSQADIISAVVFSHPYVAFVLALSMITQVICSNCGYAFDAITAVTTGETAELPAYADRQHKQPHGWCTIRSYTI